MSKLALLALTATLTLYGPASATEAIVHDGDTFRIENVKIRLWGIDAPELRQFCMKDHKSVPCGQKAKILLETLIGSTEDLECTVIDTDPYGRQVARCNVGGADLGSMMVRAGYALAYRRYSKDFYDDQEDLARSEGRGLWGMDFQQPWDWRKKGKR